MYKKGKTGPGKKAKRGAYVKSNTKKNDTVPKKKKDFKKEGVKSLPGAKGTFNVSAKDMFGSGHTPPVKMPVVTGDMLKKPKSKSKPKATSKTAGQKWEAKAF